MTICKSCFIPMIEVIGFRPNEKNKHDRFCRCPKCKRETKHIKIDNSELSFGEYIEREIRKAGR